MRRTTTLKVDCSQNQSDSQFISPRSYYLCDDLRNSLKQLLRTKEKNEMAENESV